MIGNMGCTRCEVIQVDSNGNVVSVVYVSMLVVCDYLIHRGGALIPVLDAQLEHTQSMMLPHLLHTWPISPEQAGECALPVMNSVQNALALPSQPALHAPMPPFHLTVGGLCASIHALTIPTASTVMINVLAAVEPPQTVSHARMTRPPGRAVIFVCHLAAMTHTSSYSQMEIRCVLPVTVNVTGVQVPGTQNALLAANILRPQVTDQ